MSVETTTKMELHLYSLLATVITHSWANVVVNQSPNDLDPYSTREILSSDFESGSMSPWYDLSTSSVNWQIERLDSSTETNSAAPQPASGETYLRLTRNANLDLGLAILNSAVFIALPGDQVNFTFWIRSRQPLGNSLQVISMRKSKSSLAVSSFPFEFISRLTVVRGARQQRNTADRRQPILHVVQ